MALLVIRLFHLLSTRTRAVPYCVYVVLGFEPRQAPYQLSYPPPQVTSWIAEEWVYLLWTEYG